MAQSRFKTIAHWKSLLAVSDAIGLLKSCRAGAEDTSTNYLYCQMTTTHLTWTHQYRSIIVAHCGACWQNAA